MIFLAILSLYATIQLFFHGNEWLALACASYFVLGIFIYYANAKVALVEMENGTENGTGMITENDQAREWDRHESPNRKVIEDKHEPR